MIPCGCDACCSVIESVSLHQRAALARRRIACHHEGMGNAATLGSPEDDDSPEVRALRKHIRNEPLTPEEQALLARVSRPVPEGAVLVPHDEVTRKLEERRRCEG